MTMPNALLANLIGPLSGFELSLIGIILVLGFVIWALTRHKECAYDGEPDGGICENLPAVAGSTHGHPCDGNQIDVIQDAEFFQAFSDMVESATGSVHLETYLWDEGDASDRVVGDLCKAARRGLAVRILADARGASGVSKETRERLTEAGCRFERFHRWLPRNLGRFNVRDHRKILIVDGETALLGGHCITDRWLLDEPEKPRYRDVSVRVSGPVVTMIQSAFSENWQEVVGEPFTDQRTFPKLEPTGGSTAHIAYIRPDGCPSSVQVLHYLAIAYAKKTIRIQNPYFLPDPQGAKALIRAVERGVDVQIMTPAISASDTPYVQRAGHFLFGRLLEGGVRIFEYQPTLLHQKIIMIDGCWCGIGSSNFDDRSFEINDEITLGIADENVVSELEAIFDSDLEECEERHWEQWKGRSLWKRAVDGLHYLANEQL